MVTCALLEIAPCESPLPHRNELKEFALAITCGAQQPLYDQASLFIPIPSMRNSVDMAQRSVGRRHVPIYRDLREGDEEIDSILNEVETILSPS